MGRKYVEQLPEGAVNMIHEKAEKNHPLTDEQKASNREKSRIRCRIEHIFGFMTGAMHGITVRSIGLARAKFNIGMMNLVYNLCRYVFLMRPKKRGLPGDNYALIPLVGAKSRWMWVDFSS